MGFTWSYFSSEVKNIYNKSDVIFIAFNVKYANSDITKEFKEEIENFNDI